VFARDMRSGERLASCVRSFEPSLTRASSGRFASSYRSAMAEKRKKGVDVNRVLLRLGLDCTSQSRRAQRRAGDERDAQRLAGDERDAQRIPHLREKLKDAPEFLTVPMSEWCAPQPLDPRVRFSLVVAFSGRI
jgi:hypothetical protein